MNQLSVANRIKFDENINDTTYQEMNGKNYVGINLSLSNINVSRDLY